MAGCDWWKNSQLSGMVSVVESCDSVSTNNYLSLQQVMKMDVELGVCVGKLESKMPTIKVREWLGSST